MSVMIHEAIERISNNYKTAIDQYHRAINGRFYKAARAWRRDVDLYEMVLAALREKDVRENPEPLTLEELRQMDGEPVWVQKLNSDKSFWMLAYKDQVSNRIGWLDYRDYGKAWVAYHHKPKEE